MRQPRKSLFEILRSRLDRGKRSDTPKPVAAPRPFQAVSIYCGINACSSARRFSDHRFLAKDAPQLPLTGCTHPGQCDCRYLKYKDRRSEQRRAIDFLAIRHFGVERRKRPGRRSTD